MTVIEASSARCKTLADGTLQITVSVEPRDAVSAFTLFGSPGVPMALAALKTGQGITPPEKTPPEPAKRGPACMWLVMRCQEPEFREWLADEVAREVGDEASAVKVVRELCGVASRTEIDGNAEAESRFDSLIRKPYVRHMKLKQRSPA